MKQAMKYQVSEKLSKETRKKIGNQEAAVLRYTLGTVFCFVL